MTPLLLGVLAAALAAPVEAWVESSRVPSGTPIVLWTTHWGQAPVAAEAGELEPRITLDETLGPRRTLRTTLTGADGSHIIRFPDTDLPPIFVDIGAAGPNVAPLPPPVPIPEARAAPLLLLLVSALLIALGVITWRRRALPAVIPLAPQRVALDAWDAARATLTGRALALALARILRRFLAARYGWPAPTRTTGELTALAGDSAALPPALRSRLITLLAASEPLRFGAPSSEAAAVETAALLERLDEELRTFIAATWETAP